ncbi:hypothetical protein HYH03_000349 [Edaphochlamys debaryana]|uniref:Coenzyme Q-binding protein COQ10 START domain-containing protein n=1 Tax=Edaphochlamys debaryana TaxID=47281 RepID=A0A836C633_9CHLO|nr:hypothetical protein HYH03_000349 [Edaphochlamys debaryana]|eukprot:KAG2501851.1 hypothetical protein HYH03_000349 [Edaphochlamys debaryana]
MTQTQQHQPEGAIDRAEAWHEGDTTINVSERPGFLYTLQLRSKIDASPAEVFDVLTDPDPAAIFRSIKAGWGGRAGGTGDECTYRRILEDDQHGRRKLEIGHRAVARFLFVSIGFETHLHVWEDRKQRTIDFYMAKPGLMQKFDGCWRIKPFTQETLDSIYHPERLERHAHGPFGAGGLLGFLHRPAQAQESLVTLEQSILPRGHTPVGIKGLVRGLCAHQLRCMMEDLRRELQRRKEERRAVEEAVVEGRSHGHGHGHAGRHDVAVAPAASLSAALWRNASPLSISLAL